MPVGAEPEKHEVELGAAAQRVDDELLVMGCARIGRERRVDGHDGAFEMRCDGCVVGVRVIERDNAFIGEEDAPRRLVRLQRLQSGAKQARQRAAGDGNGERRSCTVGVGKVVHKGSTLGGHVTDDDAWRQRHFKASRLLRGASVMRAERTPGEQGAGWSRGERGGHCGRCFDDDVLMHRPAGPGRVRSWA